MKTEYRIPFLIWLAALIPFLVFVALSWREITETDRLVSPSAGVAANQEDGMQQVPDPSVFQRKSLLKKNLGASFFVLTVFCAGLGWGMARRIRHGLDALWGILTTLNGKDFSKEWMNYGPDECSALASLLQETVATRNQQALLAHGGKNDGDRGEKGGNAALLAQIEQGRKDLEELAYVASHDLQEPLRMVTSYTQLLEKKYGDLLDEKACKYLFYARDGAERMQDMILGLLEFSRIHTHGHQMVATDLNQCVDAALLSLQRDIEVVGPVLHKEALPEACCDGSQITALFRYLLQNSLQYTKAEQPEIRIFFTDQKTMWQVTVSDNGIGFSMEHQEKIFKLFKRLHTRNEYPGTGTGLAICRRITERHGGALTVAAKPGNGSAFSFTLPKTCP